MTTALETMGPQVQNWDLEFSEELLWMPSPEATPEAPREDSGESKRTTSTEQNLELPLEAENQFQSKEQQSASYLVSKGTSFSLQSQQAPALVGPFSGGQQPKEVQILITQVDGLFCVRTYRSVVSPVCNSQSIACMNYSLPSLLSVRA